MPQINHEATDAELAILSLLAEQPLHGYQIERTIEERGMREWTAIGFSSIYYILNKLRARRCVESGLESAAGKGPPRQVFALTRHGRQVFQAAALNALSAPSRSFSNFQLGLAAIPGLTTTEVLIALRSYQSFLIGKKASLKDKHASLAANLPWHVAALFDRDFAQLQCELDWLDGFIEAIQAKSGE